jgi:hypothetical protein
MANIRKREREEDTETFSSKDGFPIRRYSLDEYSFETNKYS